ncbi:MGMT family protein [Streptomyces sp. WM6378]|uniref:MGMT family protein n=1 Tax=Streptomyces sp. WM6378 TaxID=1415557 RepID=UPI000B0CB0C5|nr:MGMT family protein [Streptomyces sp. WM6378]
MPDPGNRPPPLLPHPAMNAQGPAARTEQEITQGPDRTAIADPDDEFIELVRVHADAVHVFLHRISGSARVADTAGRDVFLEARATLRTHCAGKQPSPLPRPWLMTLALKRWHALASPSAVAGAVGQDAEGQLCAALAGLPEKIRTAVVLRHVVQLSYAEAAHVQGCPAGSVKAQVSRGLSELRRRLAAAADGPRDSLPSFPEPVRALPLLGAAVRTDFAAQTLEQAGIPSSGYDSYVREQAPAGGLFVAFGRGAVTGTALHTRRVTAEVFEATHRARTGRSAIRTSLSPAGLHTLLRTGTVRDLRVDLPGLGPHERAVLEAVRAIPNGQLRPVSWIARTARLPAGGASATVLGALARNPLPVLVPCHRATHDCGTPCDASYPSHTGDILRAAEGMDLPRLDGLTRRGVRFVGSTATRTYCHPTCPRGEGRTEHQVFFSGAGQARGAGFAPCPGCTPVAAARQEA